MDSSNLDSAELGIAGVDLAAQELVEGCRPREEDARGVHLDHPLAQPDQVSADPDGPSRYHAAE
jgi:hypothetical protein